MITIKQSGDFSKTFNFLERAKGVAKVSILDKYGRLGVQALKEATPVDTGKTADSWYYRVEQSGNDAELNFYNSNIVRGTPIAVILQYGHGTRNGGWVQGVDYINPVLTPIFDKIAEETWKELTE